MGSPSTFRAMSAAVVVLGSAVAAFAQDYTVTQLSGQWKPVPATATDFGLTGDDVTKIMNPTPFPIPYFGQSYTSMVVSTNGFVQLGGGNNNGCCSPVAGPISGTLDGVLGVAWSDLYITSGALTSTVYTWIEGSAPNRTLVVTWANASLC
jgi:hypothetical protein